MTVCFSVKVNEKRVKKEPFIKRKDKQTNHLTDFSLENLVESESIRKCHTRCYKSETEISS